jgi:hypothetical protein
LGTGGLLHDIGLVRLPQNIMKRPKMMSLAQQTLYESHTIHGVTILEKSGSTDQAVLAIVKGHQSLTAPIEQTGETSFRYHRSPVDGQGFGHRHHGGSANAIIWSVCSGRGVDGEAIRGDRTGVDDLLPTG